MRLNTLKFSLMNNPLRAAFQRWVETPLLLGQHASLSGPRVLEIARGLMPGRAKERVRWTGGTALSGSPLKAVE